MLEIAVRHAQGDFVLEADLSIGSGLTALFGASGSGKTTLINLVAGLLRPTQGRIALDGEVWSDSATGHFRPPHRRRIGYVFQEGRLFPHLTVRQNLLYGQRFTPAGQRRESLERVVGLLGLGPLVERRPAGLSGGEKQRVALGRALLASPHLLLMDEPLSALDVELKAAILPDIERIRDEVGIPILYVSHSLEEVSRLATQVVAMDHGRAKPLGSPDAVLETVSRVDGMPPGNFLHAVVTSHSVEEGLTLADSPAGPLFLRRTDVAVGTHIRAFVPVSEIALATSLPDGISMLNRLSGTITDIRDEGASAMVAVDCAGERLIAEVTRRSARVLTLAPGMPVHLLFKAVSIATEGIYRSA
ncbi:molybdenum import ATP-binding protein ModC [Ciceribacter naphthalenivorans]|uniref:Molybdenum import ATP-binding protein ModC n=3 Tax=Alphaproteobacteria TaxID=28211 RepID=A0A512HF55_9HYPH|nr:MULTISPECIES: molybdenum ABC transporter ATP-binding protein [Alphaproteobacteria]GEO84086.1 molybdenum import ATP-binding protein ModC [Ciceribacter naphthalenivorans]GLR24622.1 molybdenum import ATP-binding protein ModC [Ciceribacter naphthalenivorans]GLT07478.1 molybdenum import ATP-binding protein ModC [Sphingomonas psychrolutea]